LGNTSEAQRGNQAKNDRPFERLYPVVIFDALRSKIRAEGTVKNEAV